MKNLLCLIPFLFLFACTPSPVPAPIPSALPSAAPSPVVVTSPLPTGNYPVKGWDARYSEYIKANVTQVMIDSDPQTLVCPGYSRATGREAWAAIIQADSYAECGWDRTQDYTENFKDSVTGKLAVSSGLMQMSISDDNYEGCHFGTPAGLHDPILNLECALKTMNRLLKSKDSSTYVYRALSSYWSSFNPDSGESDSKGEGFCTMRKKLKQIYPACKTVTSDCE